MKNVYFAICFQCNHKCVFCPREPNDSVGMLSFEQIENNVIFLKQRYKSLSITLSGGEPTLHPKFFEIAKMIVSNDIPIVLLTNGESLYNRSFLDKFIKVFDKKNIYVVTAIHSINSDSHDMVTQVKGSCKRTLTGLKELTNIGYSVVLKFILTKQNYREIKDYIEYYYRYFNGKIHFNICGVDCSGIAKDNSFIAAISFNESKQYLEKALDLCEQYLKDNVDFRFSVSEMPLCSVDPYYWKYFVYGKKRDHEVFSSPNIKTNSFLLFNPPSECYPCLEKCSKCLVKNVCPGIWNNTAKIIGEDGITPFLQ